MKDKNTVSIQVKVVIVQAETKGKDFGIGPGVMEILNIDVSADPTRAAIQLLNWEDAYLKENIRFDMEEKIKTTRISKLEKLCTLIIDEFRSMGWAASSCKLYPVRGPRTKSDLISFSGVLTLNDGFNLSLFSWERMTDLIRNDIYIEEGRGCWEISLKGDVL